MDKTFLEKNINTKVFVKLDNMPEEVMNRIVLGAMKSETIKPFLLRYFEGA